MKTEKEIKDYIAFLEDYLESEEINEKNIETVRMKLEVLRWVVND